MAHKKSELDTESDDFAVPKSVHLLSESELNDYWVSELSQFKEMKWQFKNFTPGARASLSTINWEMTLFDESKLSDSQHRIRLRWSKLLVLSIITVPARGRIPSGGAFSTIQNELNIFLSWMSLNGYHLPEELTPRVIENYVDELPAYVASRDHYRDDEDEGIGVAVFDRALNPLMRLWEQRGHLALFNVKTLSAHPFNGNGAHSVALKLATKARGWIMPLPDEVAIPLFNKAASFLGAPAQDAVRLLGLFNVSDIDVEKHGKAKKQRLQEENGFLKEFKFTDENPYGQSWHQRLITPGASAATIREIFDSIRDAATITVQGVSGMRVSELCGIPAGIDQVTGLPAGVRLETSLTGLYEWFIIRSELSKSKEGKPREVDWVLGMRPVGSKEIPLAVHALCVLNELHMPWRATAKTSKLLLAGPSGVAMARPSKAMAPMTSDNVRRNMKRFIERHIDLSQLPDTSARNITDKDLVRWRETKGNIFSTHMLRKSWANFTLACDSRLLPVIQMQFHHVSLAITEGAYIGKNPVLVDALDSVSRQRTNRGMYELITQRTAFAGRMGEHLESEAEKLRKQFEGLPLSERWKKTTEWVDDNQITMFFSPYSICVPLKRSEMRCHESTQTPIWIRNEPNVFTREPSLCAGCGNAVMDKTQSGFWEDRYMEYMAAMEMQKLRDGRPLPEMRVIEFRANQSRAILKKLGVDMEALAKRLALRLVKENG